MTQCDQQPIGAADAAVGDDTDHPGLENDAVVDDRPPRGDHPGRHDAHHADQHDAEPRVPPARARSPSRPTDRQAQVHEELADRKAGKVTVDFTNKSPVPHDMVIQQGTNGSVVGQTPVFSGGSKTFTVKLKPGTYTFYCSVPGHRRRACRER